MAKRLKPAEKRRMRQQLAEVERDIDRLRARAAEHGRSCAARDVHAKIADALQTAEILRMYVG